MIIFARLFFSTYENIKVKCMFHPYCHKNKCPGSYCIDFLFTITMGMSTVQIDAVMVGLITSLLGLFIIVFVGFLALKVYEYTREWNAFIHPNLQAPVILLRLEYYSWVMLYSPLNLLTLSIWKCFAWNCSLRTEKKRGNYF